MPVLTIKINIMPYLIETYRQSKNAGLLCTNIDNFLPYQTKEAANEAIKVLYAEQVEMNKQLEDMYLERLQAQVMDENTDDTIIRPFTPYALIYKIGKYTKTQIKNMP